MAWTTTSNVSTGDVLSATTFNNQVLGNLTELRGDWAQSKYTSGNLTINSTSWANVATGTDLTLAAESGDVIEVGLSVLAGSEAVDAMLDVVTLVGSTVTNSFATGGAVDASGQGIACWRCNSGVLTSVGGPFWYKLVSGDVSGGNVVLRLRYRTGTATNKTLYQGGGLHFVFTARNHGQVEI